MKSNPKTAPTCWYCTKSVAEYPSPDPTVIGEQKLLKSLKDIEEPEAKCDFGRQQVSQTDGSGVNVDAGAGNSVPRETANVFAQTP